MVDPRAETIDVTIGVQDFEITQSPGILQSNREAGTTGAVVWQICIEFAQWIAWPDNFLFKRGILNSESTALELGSGVSGIIPMVLDSRVQTVVATDQPYLLKKLQENISSNSAARPNSNRRRGVSSESRASDTNPASVAVIALDWETDDVERILKANRLKRGIDLLIACDCIFNYALIDPFVQTCMDVCRVRESCDDDDEQMHPATLCIIAQQLRQPEVFTQWLNRFRQSFRVWRIPDDLLSEGLQEGSGFVVHLGILRTAFGLSNPHDQ